MRYVFPKRGILFLLVAGFALSVSGPLSVDAHPHVYIANRFVVMFDDQGLAGIRVNWVFDKYFSNMIISDYDADGNASLEPSEVAQIERVAFRNLSNFGFFMNIKIDGKPFAVKFVQNFNARIKANGALVYAFTVPCHVSAVPGDKEIRAAPYDPSYYTQILFAETDKVRIEGGQAVHCRYRVEKNPVEAYYNGLIHPYEMVLTFRKKQ